MRLGLFGSGKDLIAHGAELRTCLGAEYLRHDISAERGSYLNKTRVFVHFENGAVRRQPRFETGGDTRRERPADIRCADKDGRGLDAFDEIREGVRIRKHDEIRKFGIIVNVNAVNAVFEKQLHVLFGVMSDQKREDLVFCDGCKFARLSDQLKRDGVKDAFLRFGIDAHAVPERFVNKFVMCLDDRHDALRPFFDAEFAHTATRADVEFSVLVRYRGERTAFHQCVRRFGRNA